MSMQTPGRIVEGAQARRVPLIFAGFRGRGALFQQ